MSSLRNRLAVTNSVRARKHAINHQIHDIIVFKGLILSNNVCCDTKLSSSECKLACLLPKLVAARLLPILVMVSLVI